MIPIQTIAEVLMLSPIRLGSVDEVSTSTEGHHLDTILVHEISQAKMTSLPETLHQKCPTFKNRTIFILQRALISITSPCVRISTSQKKLPPSKHPLGDGKKHPKAPMFDGMDAIAC